MVIIDPETWNRTRERFDMVIDMDMDPSDVLETKAIVNFDSLTGTFYVPRRARRRKDRPINSRLPWMKRGSSLLKKANSLPRQ